MMAAPMGPPGRRLQCDDCGRKGHTARSHQPGGILYVAPAPQDGPDLLAELAEVERTPAQVLADAVESVRTSDAVPTPIAEGRTAPDSTGVERPVRTAQQLADAETAAGRLERALEVVEQAAARPRRGGKRAAVAAAAEAASAAGEQVKVVGRDQPPEARLGAPRRFITPAGEIKTISGPDATGERQQGLCADGAWSRNPDDGTWSCAVCGRPAAAPVLEQIEALQDDAPGQLVAVDLPPLQPRARWTIDPAVALGALLGDDPLDPGPAFPGADCDCLGDGDLHPPGSGGCVATEADGIGAVPEQLQDDSRPVDDVELPDVIRDAVTHQLGPGEGSAALRAELGTPDYADDPWPVEGLYPYGPDPFGPPWATSAGPLGPIRITLPGVYHLTDTEYHNPAVTGDWVSNSDLKAMTVDGCPAQWRYDRDNGVTDDREVYLFGKAVHAEVLGKGADVIARPAEWKDWRKTAAREWRAEQLAAGLVPVTPEEAETAREMAAAVHADPDAAEALSRPGRPEVALFWREQLPSGRWVQRRAMVDYLTDDGDPIDYKTAESSNPNERMERAIYEYGYHRQAVTYESAIVALDLSPTYPKMLFLFQQKKAPYLVTPVELDDRAGLVGEGETLAALEVYAECVETGYWPGYGKTIMTIPEYRGREFDEEMT